MSADGTMTDDSIHVLTAAYALDALPPEERASFAVHLEECDSCVAETAQLIATAARLALLTEEPAPEHLRAAVLHEVGQIAQVSPVVSDLSVRRASRTRRRAVIVAIGAAAAAAAAIGTVVILDESPAERIVAAADARTFDATMAGGGTATLVVSEIEDAGLVTFAGLTEPAEGMAFQLWLIDSDGPRPVGDQFEPGDDGTASAVIEDAPDADAVAVTLEASDAPTVPTDPILVVIPTSST